MKPALLALTLLTACTDPRIGPRPRIGAGLHLGPHGTSVTPRISGSLGAARIGLSGYP